MAKEKDTDGLLLEYLLRIVSNILSPKSVIKAAQKKIDSLSKKK